MTTQTIQALRVAAQAAKREAAALLYFYSAAETTLNSLGVAVQTNTKPHGTNGNGTMGLTATKIKSCLSSTPISLRAVVQQTKEPYPRVATALSTMVKKQQAKRVGIGLYTN